MMVLYNLEKFSYVIEEILFCLLGAWFMFVRRRRLRCLDCCKSAFASFFYVVVCCFAFCTSGGFESWCICCSKLSSRQVMAHSALGKLGVSHRKLCP